MKNTVVFIVVLLLFPFFSSGQEPMLGETDSVMVYGAVFNTVTGRPQGGCEVQLFRGDSVQSMVFADLDGEFDMGRIPAGIYSLSVFAEGYALYRAEVVLETNAILNVWLLPDTVKLRTLSAVEVTSVRNKLGNMLIRNADDGRLWNFSGKMLISGPASKDLSGSPFHLPFLASFRPAWLDAPVSKQKKVERKACADDEREGEEN